LWYKEGKRIK